MRLRISRLIANTLLCSAKISNGIAAEPEIQKLLDIEKANSSDSETGSFDKFLIETQLLEAYRKVYSLASSREHVIPGHDPLVLERYPAPRPELQGWVVRLD